MFVTEYGEDEVFAFDENGSIVKTGCCVTTTTEYLGENDTDAVENYGIVSEMEESSSIVTVDICEEALSA